MKFIILGCGSSMGVPRPDGFFGNCDPKNKKNYRTRCSALIKTDQENILIDTSPDLRNQMLSQKIKKIDKVLIETDSPFLAPVPNRGKKNEPSFIDYTAQKLADIKNISKSELVKITTNNFNRLFFN